MTAEELYDLSTNPEELPALDLLKVATASNFDTAKGVLLKHLKGWYQCIKHSDGEDGVTNCETVEAQ